jgi:imidazole glycerol-phosphate synthase subunit HisH
VKVGIVNYGMGNLGSVRRALEELGADAFIADHPVALFDAQRVILPGVGSFTEGMARLNEGGWSEMLRKLVLVERRPLLGICLGMQMLAGQGEEGGDIAGLQLIEGRVVRLDKLGCKLRIPHVGWNDVSLSSECPLFNHIPAHSDFYFVHSFALHTTLAHEAIATTSYGIDVVAAVRRGNVFGTQFHPEKSSKAGRQLLRNYLEYVPC